MADPLETTRGVSRVSETPDGNWVLVVVGSGDLRTYTLTADAPLVVGRDPTCDVTLDHHRVSRRHARVGVAASYDTYTVEDLGSRNGTQLGGMLPPNEPHTARAGESIVIGPFTLVAVREAAAQPSSSLAIEDPLATTPSPVLTSVAKSSTNVLLRGESGVGKQVLVETIHRLSGRGGRLVSINCAAIGNDLLESELFGHEKGAFTGAIAMKPGLLEVAGEGTVLLDEIGDMPAALQAKLLRAVETRELQRVGGTVPIPIRARFVSATHRDLLGAVEGGSFRLDLYYRLAGVTLSIPPLRERRGSIVPLARELLASAAAREGRPAPRISPAAAARLQAYDWPGNVRELRNLIDRALIFSAGETVDPAHLVFDEPARPARTAATTTPASRGEIHQRDEGPATEVDERSRIVEALAACAGNQTRAARMLAMSRTTFVQRLILHGIMRPQKPKK